VGPGGQQQEREAAGWAWADSGEKRLAGGAQVQK
jgi:hypothetical protein